MKAGRFRHIVIFGTSLYFWEECYLLEGQVTVETPDGEKVAFGVGDFVRFPRGLDCVWNSSVPVKKHFIFQ